MYKVSADWVFPVASAPIKEGVVVCNENGKIYDIGERKDYADEELDILEGFLVPGFINTHCHLELSHMKGMLKEGTGLIEFIKGVLAKREAPIDVIQAAIESAEAEMISNGIVAVGDISNTDHTFKQKYQNNLRYHTFVEVFNFVPDAATDTFNHGKYLYERLTANAQRASIVPHAPYTVSPDLFLKIKVFAKKNDAIVSMHNQETKDENEFFLTKKGGFNDFYKDWGFDISFFKPTGKNALTSVIDLLPEEQNMLLVHNTMSTREDIQLAHQHNGKVYWCFNPNANLYIEETLPNYDIFIEENAKCTIGTDSLASNWQLSILDEMKVISEKAPDISLEQLLEWACLNGAEFLKMDEELGSFKPGKTPGINLIRKVDVTRKKLTSESNVVKLK